MVGVNAAGRILIFDGFRNPSDHVYGAKMGASPPFCSHKRGRKDCENRRKLKFFRPRLLRPRFRSPEGRLRRCTYPSKKATNKNKEITKERTEERQQKERRKERKKERRKERKKERRKEGRKEIKNERKKQRNKKERKKEKKK